MAVSLWLFPTVYDCYFNTVAVYSFCNSLSLLYLLINWRAPSIAASTDHAEVDKQLDLGKRMLQAGQLTEALSHFHSAVELDPNNYLSYFRRATTYLAMGKSKAAVNDLSKVIELKSDFTGALVQRGNVYLKQGRMEDARSDFRQVLSKDSSNTNAKEQLDVIADLEEKADDARDLFENSDYANAIPLLTAYIEQCPWDTEIRQLRANSYQAQGDYSNAINDLKPVAKLIPDNTAAYFRISQLYYAMGDADESLVQIRECLKLDPDHKECYSLYKKVKKLAKQLISAQELKQNKEFDECVHKADQILKTDSQTYSFILKAKSFLCHCHAQNGHITEAKQYCGEVLDMDHHNIEAYCDRGDAYILVSDYEAAINDFQEAQKIHQEHHRADEGLKRAQKLLKQSQKRDYYKILGVKRSARKPEIMRAYRKLAMQWHPDKYEEGEKKEKAQKKFIDIAAAKEVLTNPEHRQKFDNGEDPLDPESQAGQGFNPFGEGFNPFGSGFNFKFHFG